MQSRQKPVYLSPGPGGKRKTHRRKPKKMRKQQKGKKARKTRAKK